MHVSLRAGSSAERIARTLIVPSIVAACATGCDPGSAARPRFEPIAVAPARDFVSGARLRAKIHVLDDLVEVFTTFHDTQLDLDCAYDDEAGMHLGPGGAAYCLPSGLAHHRRDTGPYLDSECTVPAAFAPATGTPAYAVLEPRDACATEPEVRRALPPKARRPFFRDALGACGAGDSGNIAPLGEVVPLSTFVRAVEEIEPRTGRMAVRVLAGSDGSRRVVGGYDRDRGEATRVGPADDGARRWLPARIAFVGGGELLFGDAACVVPVASKIARTAACPLGAAVVLAGTCGAGSYYALGPQLTSVFSRNAANACVESSVPDLFAFALGAPVSARAFAPVAETAIGTPRVRRRGYGTFGEPPITWSEIVDGMTGEPCEVVPMGDDGTLRCLPAAGAVVSFFADSACTERAISRAVTGCEVGADPRFVRDVIDVPPRVFGVIAPLDVVYTQDAGRCVPFNPAVESRSFSVREVDAASFPPAVLRTE